MTLFKRSHFSFEFALTPALSFMPKARKRKQPLTSSDTAKTSSTPKVTRKVIRRFHVLLKKKAQSNAAGIQSDSGIDDEVEALGGLENYQKV